jgi:hypothetical protein
VVGQLLNQSTSRELDMDAAAVTAITSAVDFSTIVTGVGAVFAAVVLIKVAMVGGKKLLAAIS